MVEDWIERWAEGRTGWHQPGGNAGLRAYWSFPKTPRRVLVPLCGKSPDLAWLANHGHEVVGIELAERAVRDFFAENRLAFDVSPGSGGHRYVARDLPLSIVQGDFFDVRVPRCDGFYDRGALVAMPAAMRPRYVDQVQSLLEVDSARLVITLEYDQAAVAGPPFAVLADELAGYWPDLERVAESDDIDNSPPKFRAAGIDSVREVVWRSR